MGRDGRLGDLAFLELSAEKWSGERVRRALSLSFINSAGRAGPGRFQEEEACLSRATGFQEEACLTCAS